MFARSTLFLLSALVINNLYAAEQRYITDKLEITLRSGESTSHQILRMMKSGQEVQLLNTNNETGYSQIRLANGNEGYVLSRFLTETPPALVALPELKLEMEQTQSNLVEAQHKIESLEAANGELNTQQLDLQSRYKELQLEYQQNLKLLGDTPRVVQQNQQLMSDSQTLNQQIVNLQQKNRSLRDDTEMRWFMRGAGVTFGAFLMGILVTRIRWKKRDSWGSL